MKQFFQDRVQFFRACWRELPLISWPSRELVWNQFRVVLVLSSALVVVLYSLDLLFRNTVQLLIKQFA